MGQLVYPTPNEKVFLSFGNDYECMCIYILLLRHNNKPVTVLSDIIQHVLFKGLTYRPLSRNRSTRTLFQCKPTNSEWVRQA